MQFKVLKTKRETVKRLREEREAIRAEKTDMYNKAMDVNTLIGATRKELETLYAKRADMTAEIDKQIAARKKVSTTIDEKRKEINVFKASKRVMFDNCTQKKLQILEKDKAIMKEQADIKSIKGSGKDW